MSKWARDKTSLFPVKSYKILQLNAIILGLWNSLLISAVMYIRINDTKNLTLILPPFIYLLTKVK